MDRTHDRARPIYSLDCPFSYDSYTHVINGTVLCSLSLPFFQVVLILSLANVTINQVVDDVALKLVFANAMLNPVFYGLCRKNYRKGYSYITQLFFHYLSCGVVDKPGGK